MTELADYDKIDPTFFAELDASEKAVELAVRILRKQGIMAAAAPVFKRPKPEKMREFTDCGDIRVYGGVIEVKQRHLHFTSCEDFRYDTTIVDTVHHWLAMRPRPIGYLIFNETLTACHFILGLTSGSWTTDTTFDRSHNHQKRLLYCPKELCIWLKVEDMYAHPKDENGKELL